MAPRARRPRAALLRVAAFAIGLAAVFVVVLVLVARSPEDIQHAADGAGTWAPIAFVALCAGLTLAFFPFPLVAAAGGVLFGTLEGTLLSILGGSAGAALAFLLARYAAHDAVEALAGDRLRRVRAAVARRGFVAVLYARIVPGVPRDVANYAFGLTDVGFVAFTAATVDRDRAARVRLHRARRLARQLRLDRVHRRDRDARRDGRARARARAPRSAVAAPLIARMCVFSHTGSSEIWDLHRTG